MNVGHFNLNLHKKMGGESFTAPKVALNLYL